MQPPIVDIVTLIFLLLLISSPFLICILLFGLLDSSWSNYENSTYDRSHNKKKSWHKDNKNKSWWATDYKHEKKKSWPATSKTYFDKSKVDKSKTEFQSKEVKKETDWNEYKYKGLDLESGIEDFLKEHKNHTAV